MIRLEKVSKEYWHQESRWSAVALDGVSFEVRESEFVCVLGPSGCGKSTLLNLIAGFVRPTCGRIRFNGGEVVGPGPDRGVVFQDPTLFPWLTARQNVEFGLRSMGLPRRERRRRAEEALHLMALDGFADAWPHALSGGMRQRVALARVLVMEPMALLMDEPFGSLDAHTRDRLQDELLRIWELHKKTILFVTHNVEEAVYLGDRVILMGPAPRSIVADTRIAIPRPRSRSCAEIREMTQALRGELSALPCCMARAAQEAKATSGKGG